MVRGDSRREVPLADVGAYQRLPDPPVPSLLDLELEAAHAPSTEWDHIQNLDAFFIRLYRYYSEKGLWCMLLSRVLDVLTLLFTLSFSGVLLFAVDWQAVVQGCPDEDNCDFMQLALISKPLQTFSPVKILLAVTYCSSFGLYFLWTVLRTMLELPSLLETHRFVTQKLGLQVREVQSVAWSEVVGAVVAAQTSMRLCVVKHLTPLEIVARIMRKENFLIGMLNKQVLQLYIDLPLIRRYVMLSKLLEWNLYWCVLDYMFDDNFLIRRDFTRDSRSLRTRLRVMALGNLLVSPFLLVFLLLYFFLRNAEALYHHPSSIGARNWSALTVWKLRQFNEVPHLLNERLNSGYEPAVKYVGQFPSFAVSFLAKFVAFTVGALAAGIIALALLDERLLEAHVHGRKLVWYAAIFGTVLAVSRSIIIVEHTNFCPEAAMQEVVKHTHYFPHRWRNRCHSRAVQSEFESMFQYKAVGFLEEMLSILVTPFILAFALPNSVDNILTFVRDFSVRIDGVGDVGSLSVFDFERHGNAKYASPVQCAKSMRSNQGKMEKSFLTFHALYPNWEPDTSGRLMLNNLQNFRGSSAHRSTIASIAAAESILEESPQPGAQQSIRFTYPESNLLHRSTQSTQSTAPLISSAFQQRYSKESMYNSQLLLQSFYSSHIGEKFLEGSSDLSQRYSPQDSMINSGNDNLVGCSNQDAHVNVNFSEDKFGSAEAQDTVSDERKPMIDVDTFSVVIEGARHPQQDGNSSSSNQPDLSQM